MMVSYCQKTIVRAHAYSLVYRNYRLVSLQLYRQRAKGNLQGRRERLLSNNFSQSKISQLNAQGLVNQENIFRLDVAVHNAPFMLLIVSTIYSPPFKLTHQIFDTLEKLYKDLPGFCF